MKLTGSATSKQPRPPQLIPVLGGHERARSSSVKNAVKTVGLTFLITWGIVWVPWVAWFAVDAYLLGHYDAKLGRDGGFVFGVFLRGVTGLVSALITASANGIEMTTRSRLSWPSRRGAVLVSAAILSALSPIVPRLHIAGLPNPAMGLVLPWALVSLLCVVLVLGGARLRKA